MTANQFVMPGQQDALKPPIGYNQGLRADSAEAAMQSNPMAGTLNVESKSFTRTNANTNAGAQN